MSRSRVQVVDTCSIWLTRLLVLSVPLMFLNPMNPAYYRLQVSDFIALLAIALLGWRFVVRKEIFFKFSAFSLALIAFFTILLFGAFFGQAPQKSLVEMVKLFYLWLMATVIFINGRCYKMAEDLMDWTCVAFVLVLFGGVLGGLLILVGIESPLAKATKIIGVALGIQEWLPVLPRITSFLKPTANMTAAYLAVFTLPVLDYLFSKKIPINFWGLRIALLFIIFFLGLLTMSRAFIGVLLGIWVGLTFLNWQIPGRKVWMWLIGLAAIGGWLILEIFTFFYPIDIGLMYSTDPTFVKEIVDLGTKQVPNPVYFLRPDIGAERLTLEITYALNHYAWLKYAGWKMFELSPWLGVGIGAFSHATGQLGQLGELPVDLAAYQSAQSQYFTLLGEIGILGCLALALVIVLLIHKIKAFASLNKPSAKAFLYSLPIIALISLDIDVLSFRWLWCLVAVVLVSNECSSQNTVNECK